MEAACVMTAVALFSSAAPSVPHLVSQAPHAFLAAHGNTRVGHRRVVFSPTAPPLELHCATTPRHHQRHRAAVCMGRRAEQSRTLADSVGRGPDKREVHRALRAAVREAGRGEVGRDEALALVQLVARSGMAGDSRAMHGVSQVLLHAARLRRLLLEDVCAAAAILAPTAPVGGAGCAAVALLDVCVALACRDELDESAGPRDRVEEPPRVCTLDALRVLDIFRTKNG
ncbi:MAG: hypothetical protein ACPIOQ_31130, partial [Promethearchaeia archaeon]